MQKGGVWEYSESRGYRNVRVDVFARFVLRKMVEMLQVMREKGLWCVLLQWWHRFIFEQPPPPLDKSRV
jgi:hypothetical protein